jgi:hypothetical protein
MLTFFTTGKPFRGHDEVIQWNALKSWKLLHPDIEVILFGDEPGAAQICEELGLTHQPVVDRHECGKPRLDRMFARAQQIAKHDYLCCCNCDILLMDDFRQSFEKAKAWRERFLFVSRRWDTDITEKLEVHQGDWANSLRELAVTRGFKQDESWIDLFVFRKNQYSEMPPLIVGHCYWDNWMIWRALADGVPVLDASRSVTAVHQNHGYDPKFGRTKGSPRDALSLLNLASVGGRQHLRRIDGANYRMSRSGEIRRAYLRNTYTLREPFLRFKQTFTYKVWLPAWHRFLGMTRPMRTAIGLRSREKSN